MHISHTKQYCILSFAIFIVSFTKAQYCTFPDEPYVQNHSWETYGPNGDICGDLGGWSMNHGCFIGGTTCAQSCDAGQCYCIYACEPGYCMTQFNPAADDIEDPSHGLLCGSDGTAVKVYNPTAPLCVPCAAVNPNEPTEGVVTLDGSPSPAYFITSMSRPVPICGLMDPGIDDGLQLGGVSTNSNSTCYAHMFPSWWYLPNIGSQIYIQVPGVSPEESCVTKRDPSLGSPLGNAGFYQVVFTAGGTIQNMMVGGVSTYMAFGQIAHFGDFGNNNGIDISMCWEYYQELCIVNYGVRGWVCAEGKTVPNCQLSCELFVEVSNVQNAGSPATICKRMTYCNLATCPSPTECLGPNDIQGCSPVANLNLGECIVYEFFDTPPSEIPSEVAIGRGGAQWWVIMVVVFIVILLVVGLALGYFYYRKKIKVHENI